VNKAYRQEMEAFVDIFKAIQMAKKPKVFCIYQQHQTQEVIVDKIQLEPIINNK